MNHLDLYTFRIDPSSKVDRILLECLSAEERARASSFIRAELSRLAIMARGLLRHILSPHAGVSPAALQFACNAWGKPSLIADPGKPPPVAFNVSHSANFVAIAVSGGSTVGVDIERERDLDGLDGLCERFLTASERRRVARVPERLRSDAFLRLWTRKEAALKASGIGLSLDPVRVEVGRNSAVLNLPKDLACGDLPCSFHVADISVSGMFHGAVASEVADARIRLLASGQDPEQFLRSI